MSVQTAAPIATWSVWVQPASWVRTCSPPTIAWTTYSAAAARASRTRTGWRRWVRQAAKATAATISPTTTATQRWRTWLEVRSVSGGKSEPPMSGQSGKMRAASVAVTCEPKRSRA